MAIDPDNHFNHSATAKEPCLGRSPYAVARMNWVVMHAKKSERGYTFVLEEKYQNKRGEFTPIIGESSAIGDYDDSMAKPGSSFLWVGNDHHLNREQVRELIQRMEHWLATGRLAVDPSA